MNICSYVRVLKNNFKLLKLLLFVSETKTAKLEILFAKLENKRSLFVIHNNVILDKNIFFNRENIFIELQRIYKYKASWLNESPIFGFYF